MDSVVAGNSLLVEEAISLYKEEFDRKKHELGQRVKDIMFQAEKLQRSYNANMTSLNISLDRVRSDNYRLNEVLHDREAQLKEITDPHQLKAFRGLVRDFEFEIREAEKAKRGQFVAMNDYVQTVKKHKAQAQKKSLKRRNTLLPTRSKEVLEEPELPTESIMPTDQTGEESVKFTGKND